MVHIALKHYHFRIASGTSGQVPSVSPKAPIEISAKLKEIWGPYSGWAHSVMFTADLKSFDAYKPSASSHSQIAEDSEIRGAAELIEVPTISPRKRGRTKVSLVAREATAVQDFQMHDKEVNDAGLTIADRIKQRNRRNRT